MSTDNVPSASEEAAALVASLSEEQLLQAVGTSNKSIQIAAAFAISHRPTPVLVSGLVQVASASSDGATRTALLSAIASIKSDECVTELVKPLGLQKDEDIQEAVKTSLLRSSSPAVVDALIAHAEAASTNAYLCRDIGRTLANVRDSASASNLLAGMASSIPTIFAGSASALGIIGEPHDVEALFARLGVVQSFQETLLVDVIGHVQNPAALPVLSAHLRGTIGSASPTVRHAALRALGNFSADQRTPILNEYLALETDVQLQAEARRLLNN